MALFGKGRKDAAPRAWISALEGVLAEMPAPKQLVDYVLTGRDPGALSSPGPLQWLAHSHDRGGLVDHDALTALYAGFGEIGASVLRRWGRVLETAFGSGQWGLSLGSIRGGRWLELMINQAAATAPTGPLPISFADLERIAAEDGAGATEVLTSVFALPQFARYASKKTRQHLHRVPGFGDALTAHPTVVAQAITDGSVDERVAAAAVLEEFEAPTLATFADALAEASTGGSQTVRDAMRPLLARVAADGVSPLRALATQAKPDQRAHALVLLASMPDQRGWAMETAAPDRAASVRAVAGRAEAASKAPPVDDPDGALVVARVQRIRGDLVGEPLSVVHPGRSLNPVDSLHFDDGPEPVRSSLVARLLQTGTPDQIGPAEPANARAAMPVRLTELRSLIEREAQRGCAGSVPGSVPGRLAQAHAALRRDGYSVFAGHADDIAPAECLLRSLYPSSRSNVR